MTIGFRVGNVDGTIDMPANIVTLQAGIDDYRIVTPCHEIDQCFCIDDRYAGNGLRGMPGKYRQGMQQGKDDT